MLSHAQQAVWQWGQKKKKKNIGGKTYCTADIWKTKEMEEHLNDLGKIYKDE
jgi:hypothetical protein